MKKSYCIYHIVNTIVDGQVISVSNDYICVEPTHMEYNNRLVKQPMKVGRATNITWNKFSLFFSKKNMNNADKRIYKRMMKLSTVK